MLVAVCCHQSYVHTHTLTGREQSPVQNAKLHDNKLLCRIWIWIHSSLHDNSPRYCGVFDLLRSIKGLYKLHVFYFLRVHALSLIVLAWPYKNLYFPCSDWQTFSFFLKWTTFMFGISSTMSRMHEAPVLQYEIRKGFYIEHLQRIDYKWMHNYTTASQSKRNILSSRPHRIDNAPEEQSRASNSPLWNYLWLYFSGHGLWVNISCNLFAPCNRFDFSLTLVSSKEALPIGELTSLYPQCETWGSEEMKGLIPFAVAGIQCVALLMQTSVSRSQHRGALLCGVLLKYPHFSVSVLFLQKGFECHELCCVIRGTFNCFSCC